MKVTLTSEKGEFDVTEHYRLMYDTVISSMDWGSGFLDLEEMLRVTEAGLLAGFDVKDLGVLKGYPSHDPGWETLREMIRKQLEKYDQVDPSAT